MLSVVFAAMLMHPVHETVSEIEWNTATNRLEVSLRLDILDEQWLRKRYGRGHSQLASWATRYLRQNFRVTPRPKQNQPDGAEYHWIGREEKGSHVWWFFEIEPTDAQRPSWIEQRFLWEREESYTHRILILGGVPKRSLTLTIQRPKAKLGPPENESTPK